MSRETRLATIIVAGLGFICASIPVDKQSLWFAIPLGLGVGLVLSGILQAALYQRTKVRICRREGSPLELHLPISPNFGGVAMGDIELMFLGENLVRVEKIGLVPMIRFMRGGGSADWGSTPGLIDITTPGVKLLLDKGGGWAHEWSVGEIWELSGLPVTLQPSVPLPLPIVTIRVADESTVRQRLTDGECPVLNLRYTIITDRGRFIWELDAAVQLFDENGIRL